jgi:hypothetical protein
MHAIAFLSLKFSKKISKEAAKMSIEGFAIPVSSVSDFPPPVFIVCPESQCYPALAAATSIW